MERNDDYTREDARYDERQTPPQGPAAPPPPEYQAPLPGYGRRKLPFKSTAFAIVLSVFIPSLGHIYLGYYKQAFTIMLVLAALITLVSSGVEGMEPLLGLMIAFVYFFQIFDAARRCSLYNRVLETGQAGLDSELIDLPETNPFAGGVALVAIGSLALLNTLFDFSLDWLADWWPVLMIGGGVWLIRKSRQDKGKERQDT